MRIFYDVDTQKDFMNEDGALYVPGAEGIKPNLRALTAYARRKGVRIVGSVDAHTENDPEFEIFPPHCIKGTEGQEKIIPIEQGETYFEKQHYDVFTNPGFETFLERAGISEAVVYGVATDYCVRAVVLGMQQRGIQTFVVGDAIRGVDPETTKSALEEMADSGARFVTTENVLGGRIGNGL
jgi:nicotinamidase/pyrazinamidase